MPVDIVAGAQWGDEGKGRVVDLLASEADIVMRCQGGSNAGHTVINDRGRFILHSVPSGIFSERPLCIIGAGTVLSPSGLVAELRELEAAGIDTGRLLISERAHLILPYHRLAEAMDEQRRSPESRIAPTGRGIAPTYMDKAGRCGLRAGDLLDLSGLRKKIAAEVEWKNRLLSACDQPTLSVGEAESEVEEAAEHLTPYIGDSVAPVSEVLRDDGRVLLEGQLGVMRDLDWGAYPYVTSSSPTPAGLLAGGGVPPAAVDRVIGIVKAYTSAVGTGPFPTELTDARGDELRERGAEYGATTGRPRRCGWLDAVAVAWAARVAGFTELVLTKLDILTGIERLPICTAYRDGDREIEGVPTTATLERVEPVYTELPGWEGDIEAARSFNELPLEARGYVHEVERLAGVPISMVSVGAERGAMISRLQ